MFSQISFPGADWAGCWAYRCSVDHMSCPDVPCKLGVFLPFCNLWETWLSSGTGEIKSLTSHKTHCIQSNCLEFCIWGIYQNRWGMGGGSKLQGSHKCDFSVDAEILKVNAWLSSVVKFVRPGRNDHSVHSTDQKSLNLFLSLKCVKYWYFLVRSLWWKPVQKIWFSHTCEVLSCLTWYMLVNTKWFKVCVECSNAWISKLKSQLRFQYLKYIKNKEL